MATVTAKDAKTFDPEKAQREAEKAIKAQALSDFEQELASFTWSDEVLNIAQNVTDLRIEQTETEQVPFSISLEGYDRNSPSKGCQRGEYRFTYYKGIPSLVVGLNEPLPRQMVIAQEVDVALNAFRVACANEVSVPEALRTENTTKDFDVDESGSIVFNVDVKVRGNGGNKGRGPYLYTDKSGKFPDLDGREFESVAKFCHAAGLSNPGDKYDHAPGKKYRESGSLVPIANTEE